MDKTSNGTPWALEAYEFHFHHHNTDLGLHLSSLLRIHSQDVLVVADGVLAVFVLGAHVASQGLQDAVGLSGTWEDQRLLEVSGGETAS